MSKARPIADVERTATMLDLIHRMYPSNGVSLSHVVVEEVAPTTGWARRRADALVLSVWPSKGLTLEGYEVKASRADLKRELAEPDKHRALARYCTGWWLVAWDDSVLVDGIPGDWGILKTVEGEHGDRELFQVRKAAKRTPEPWPRDFVCSLVRNAHEQSPGAAFVARATAAAFRNGQDTGERFAKSEASHQWDRLAETIYGSNRWRWPEEARDPAALVEAVITRLSQGVFSPNPAPIIGAAEREA